MACGLYTAQETFGSSLQIWGFGNIWHQGLWMRAFSKCCCGEKHQLLEDWPKVDNLGPQSEKIASQCSKLQGESLVD